MIIIDLRHTEWSNLTSNIYAIMETYNIPDILPFIAIIIIIIWPLTLHSLHSLLSILLIHWYQLYVTVHHVPKCMSCCRAILVITGRAHCFHDCVYTYNMYIYLLHPSCFCEIWALWVSWITYDHLYYALCIACWELMWFICTNYV